MLLSPRRPKRQILLKNLLNHFFACVLSLSIILNPLFSSAQNLQTYTIKPQQIFDTDYAQNPENLTAAEKEFLEATFTRPALVGLELLALMDALYRQVQNLETKYIEEYGPTDGPQFLVDRITGRRSKQAVGIEIPGVGKAELNALGQGENARIFTKIVHYGTKDAHLFFDSQQFDFDFIKKLKVGANADEKEVLKEVEDSLTFLIENQRIFSKNQNPNYAPFYLTKGNKERLTEIQSQINTTQDEAEALEQSLTLLNTRLESAIAKGRRTLVHVFDGGTPYFTKSYDKPTTRKSLSYWYKYWRGIYEKPDKKALNIGVLMAMSQGVLAYTFGGPEAAVLSLIWGGVVGVYIRTYINWKGIDSSLAIQTIKVWSISITFAYALMTWIHGFDAVFASGLSSLAMTGHVLANSIGNNLAKAHVEQIPRRRFMHNENLGEISAPIFNNIKFDRPSLENQLFYLSTFTFKIADLTHYSIQIPGLGVVPIGKILLWSSIPFMHYLTVRYLEENEYPEAAQFRREWESSKAFLVPYLGTIHDAVGKFLNATIFSPAGRPYEGHAFNYLDTKFTELAHEVGLSALAGADEFKIGAKLIAEDLVEKNPALRSMWLAATEKISETLWGLKAGLFSLVGKQIEFQHQEAANQRLTESCKALLKE